MRQGELLALLGPSGSGKTTLLRVIAGLEHADSGRVLLAGEDASQLSVQARRVGFVFQHYALFRHLNVGDNIAFGLRVRRGEARWPEPVSYTHLDVYKRQGRLRDQSARNRRTLPLAAGKFRRRVIEPVRQTDFVKHCFRAFLGVWFWQAPDI